jgi:hypothetical protein
VNPANHELQRGHDMVAYRHQVIAPLRLEPSAPGKPKIFLAIAPLFGGIGVFNYNMILIREYLTARRNFLLKVTPASRMAPVMLTSGAAHLVSISFAAKAACPTGRISGNKLCGAT